MSKFKNAVPVAGKREVRWDSLGRGRDAQHTCPSVDIFGVGTKEFQDGLMPGVCDP